MAPNLRLRTRRGTRPVVLVAPHGGLSERDLWAVPPSAARSNDLHTADLALLLAERIDGSAIANEGLDRNHVDLNRIDEVSERAPALFAALAAEVDRLLALHGRAEVFFVHGWHVVQPRCDIGTGARFADPSAAPAERLTVDRDYLDGRLATLRLELARIGVAAGFGDRWPGAHPNNVLQVFRRFSERRFEGDATRLAAGARAGRVQAVQLELGGVLRWPGALRESFVEAFAATFASPPVQAPSPHRRRGTTPGVSAGEAPPVPAQAAGDRPSAGLRFFAPRAGCEGLGLVAGIGPMPGGRLGGRLLLFPGGPRLVLFTGEERRADRTRVGALEIKRADDRMRLRFDGHALAAADGCGHFRSEAAQLGARVVALRVDLEFSGVGSGFGGVAGFVEFDGERREVETRGFSGAPWGGGVPDAAVAETRLAASFGDDLGVTLRVRAGEAVGQRLNLAGEPGVELRGAPLAEPRPPREFSIDVAGRALRCRPGGHLSWLRSQGDGRHALVTVGVAGCVFDGSPPGAGIFEHTAPVGLATAPREIPGLRAGVKVS